MPHLSRLQSDGGVHIDHLKILGDEADPELRGLTPFLSQCESIDLVESDH